MRALAIVCMLVGVAAAAQPTPVGLVVVDRDAVHTRQSLELWAGLADLIEVGDARLSLQRPESPTLAAKGRVARDAFAKAERLRQSGDLAAAGAAYAEAVQAFDESDWRLDAQLYVEALAWSGAVKRDQAALSLLFTARPDYRFPADALPAELARDVELQRQGKAKAARAAVKIESQVPAVIWLDGALAGVTPLATEALVAGRHRVTAFAPGRPLFQSVELLAPGAPLHLDLPASPETAKVQATLGEVAAALRRKEELAAARRCLELSSAPQVVLVVLSPTGTDVFRVGAAGVSVERGLPGLDAGRALAAVRRLFDRPLAPEVVEPAVVTAVPSRSRTVPALVLGAGLAGLAGGGVLIGVSQLQAKNAQQIPQTDTQGYERALGSARASLGAGIALAAVGAVAAGIGAWLLASGDSPQAARVELAIEGTGFALRGKF